MIQLKLLDPHTSRDVLPLLSEVHKHGGDPQSIQKVPQHYNKLVTELQTLPGADSIPELMLSLSARRHRLCCHTALIKESY